MWSFSSKNKVNSGPAWTVGNSRLWQELRAYPSYIPSIGALGWCFLCLFLASIFFYHSAYFILLRCSFSHSFSLFYSKHASSPVLANSLIPVFSRPLSLGTPTIVIVAATTATQTGTAQKREMKAKLLSSVPSCPLGEYTPWQPPSGATLIIFPPLSLKLKSIVAPRAGCRVPTGNTTPTTELKPSLGTVLK